MERIHYQQYGDGLHLPVTDCLCKRVPFPKLSKNWEEVTCKYCLKMRESVKETKQ